MLLAIQRGVAIVAILFSLTTAVLSVALSPFQDWDETRVAVDGGTVLVICFLLGITLLCGLVAAIVIAFRGFGRSMRYLLFVQAALSMLALVIGAIKWFGHYQG